MKRSLLTLGLSALLSFIVVPTYAAKEVGDFNGAKPQPMGRVTESVGQLQIRFPEQMVKDGGDSFKVACSPAVEGFSSWADNDTMWTFNLKGKSQWDSPVLQGGTKCQVTQVADVKSVNGKTWKTGTIQYPVLISGPNVDSVVPAAAFKGSLRESDPVILITFDGPVDATRFFAEQNGYFNYLSSNAPSEKIPLTPVPLDQAEKIFDFFKSTNVYSEIDFKDRRWILATIKQNLIPGAQLNLTIEGQTSAYNPDIKSEKKFTRDFPVRSQFQAEIECANPSAKSGNCMPRSKISVVLNGQVKWADIKDAYIEYIPYKSIDKKTVRSFAEIDKERQLSMWDMFINYIAYYFPYVAKYSDTVLDQVEFNVDIEPQTQAKIVLPKNLTDLDGRLLSNVLTEFFISIGAMDEIIRTPQELAFFEKNVEKLALPVGIVNMNQLVKIRKTGTDANRWEPIRSTTEMIRVIRAYVARGEYRSTPDYVSPLEKLGVPSNLLEQKLTGVKNRMTVLQFPFTKSAGSPQEKPVSGMYPIEVSSPSFESSQSDRDSGMYFNPKYVLAQVTDLAVHLKKGKNNVTAWVTRLSNAQPVSGASLQVLNCRGEEVATLTTDASGLVSFPIIKWAADCDKPNESYSEYFEPTQFYVSAKSGDDSVLVHSSWLSSSSSAFSSPGIEWFNSNVYENEPHYHAVIGVNLVKPGQQVPIELIAKVPNATGFQDVPVSKLATSARIVNSNDDKVFYDFPLSWVNGKAEIVWNVPSDSSVLLGRYDIIMQSGEAYAGAATGDIEVAEFKVPLMSGVIAFPSDELVRPATIPVNSVIRYANGVGAKDLKTEISYFFGPTSIENKDLPNFSFGSGPVSINDQVKNPGEDVLPSTQRPAVLDAIKTGPDGALVRDLGAESVSDGRKIVDVLKTVERPQKLVVRVRYLDQVGEYQTLSQAKTIYNAPTYVGTSLVSGTRSDARLQAAVVNVKNKTVTSLSDLDLKVIRIEARIIGEELFGGLIKNTLERELKPVRWQADCILKDGVVNCPVGTLKEGSYAFQVTSKTTKQTAHTVFKVDSEGRVYGPNDYFNDGDDEGNRQLPLALNKQAYKSGDKAVVSFASPFKTCNALVSIERSDVVRAMVVPNACEKGHVEVPVDATLAPNAFVSVYAVTGRSSNKVVAIGERDLGRPTYRLGFANMKVNWSRFKSTVTVKTEKEKYEPGQTVNVEAIVKADEGKLAAGSVTFIAIEEKILELKKNETYGILESFMQMRYHGVETITPLDAIETVEDGSVVAEPAPSEERKGGDEGGDGSSRSEFKRKLFNALVAFKANVPVENGIARFSFKANDSLTRFKVFAIATDANEKFGTGETVYLSEKATQAYATNPPTGHDGDSFPLSINMQNNMSKNQKLKAEATVTTKDANGKVLSQRKYSREVTVEKSTSKSVDLGQITIEDGASRVEYVIHVYDENGKLVDVLEPEATIVLPSVPLAIHDSLIAQTENGSLNKSLVKDPKALAGKGEIRVVASKSLVSSAVSQINLRLSQDTFADFFIQSRFNKALLMSSEAKPKEIQSLLETLISYADKDGFIKYYPQATRGSVYLTASILNSLQLEPWAMKLVPPALHDKLKTAVSLVLTKAVDPEYIGTTPRDWMRAQVVMGRAAFAFSDAMLIESAKAANAAINEELKRNPNAYGEPVEKWSNNEVVEKWLLEVFANPETALQSPFYKQLSARLVYTGNMARLKGAPGYGFVYSDETIETAKLLLGHTRVNGEREFARSLAVGLVNVSNSSWYSVLTMMSVAESLKGFGKAYESVDVSGVATLSIPEEQKSATVNFEQKSAGGLAAEWTKTKATVQVSHAGQGQPWISIQALSAIPLTAPRGAGLSIDKQIRNVTRESGFQPGDIIEVTLNVHSNSNLMHVGLLEPIPAGSNILGDAYGAYSSGQKSYAGYKLYFEYLHSGMTTVKFQYQLNLPGVFKLPPTRAEGLYMPSVYGETPNAAMTVK